MANNVTRSKIQGSFPVGLIFAIVAGVLLGGLSYLVILNVVPQTPEIKVSNDTLSATPLLVNEKLNVIEEHPLNPIASPLKISLATSTNNIPLPPPNAILCNDAYWDKCATDQEFFCPKTGAAVCIQKDIPKIIAPREITAKGLVALLCHYNSKNPSITAPYTDSDGNILNKASGAIVSPEGYILTARHTVDPEWSNIAYGASTPAWKQTLNENIVFDYCEIGIPPSETLPSVADIVKINPQLAVPHPFPYIAKLAFVPPQNDLSDLEYRQLDFAVLKISGPRPNCERFNLCSLPKAYPYNPLLLSETSPRNQQVINFGYPTELINSSGGAFTNFFLKGAVGNINEYYSGDKVFKDRTFLFEFSANDIMHGRSGSPVFYKGYITGITFSGNAKNVTIDYAVGVQALYEILKNNKLESTVRAE
ncbi:MAG: serine protease [Patescibacteria group bacterium]|mgnify:CR=1 FL=1